MKIRPFEWRDLPLLNRYRNSGLFLDSTRVLIHGSVLIPVGALLSFLAPSTRIFTYLCEDNTHASLSLVGQVTHGVGATFARLSYLAPDSAMESPNVAVLSDYMALQIGQRGIFHLLAEVDENSLAFQSLHQAGFAIYARQRIWRLDGEPAGESEEFPWRPCRSRDTLGIRSLYSNLVPGFVQQVEPLPKEDLKGMVHCQNDEIHAFVELKYGRVGVWVQPFVHPDAEGFARHLAHLLRELPGRRARPVYICVRSYQSWLETAIEAMGAQPGPLQAVMVRHLTVTRRVAQPYTLPAINGTRTETTAPIARMEDPQFLELPDVEKHPRAGSIS